MNLLFNDDLAPITSSIGFLAANIDVVADTYQSWSGALQQKRGVTLQQSSLQDSLQNVLSRLLPLTNVEPRRFLFIPTSSRWVAYFDNSMLGTDASPVMAHMARLLKCRAVRMTAVSQDREALRDQGRRSHSVIFELFEDHDTDWLNLGRSIAVANDGGWVFRLGGSEQPFETPEVYSSRKVLDRFPLPLLDQYLRALEIRAFDEQFYLPEDARAVFFERKGTHAAAMKEFTLEEARAKHA